MGQYESDLSASVTLFHRQNVGQGATTAKGPENPWLHNSPNTFSKHIFWSSWVDMTKDAEKWVSDYNTSPMGTGQIPSCSWGILSPSNLCLYTFLSKMRKGAPIQGSGNYLNSMNQNLHFN